MNSNQVSRNDLIKKLEVLFPISLAAEWDKPGKQIIELIESDELTLTGSVVVCLDVTSKVVQFAINHNASLIISRHPFIFNELEVELSNGVKKNLYDSLVKKNIQVYSIHTNYDASDERYLIKEGLSKVFDGYQVSKSKFNNETLEIKLNSMYKKGEIIRLLKEIFKVSNPQFSSNTDLNETINKFYICTGSGADTLIESNIKGVMFVTGEMKWNQWIYMEENDINAVAMGHYMENTFVKHIVELIKLNYPEINIFKFNINNMYKFLKG